MANSKEFNLFKNKFVNIITKNIKGSQQMKDGSVVRGNVVIEGFLLDESDKCFFLGSNTEEINDCLYKSDVLRISESTEGYDQFVVDAEDDGSERH